MARLPHLTLSSLPGLDAIHERLARWLVGRLYEAVGAEVQVVPMPLQLQRYGDLALASADDAQGSLLNVAGLPGQGFLLMENLLVQAWIDLLYGGGSNAPPLAQDGRKPPIAKISAIGLRAVSRLVQHLVAGYTQVWASMHATPISRPARMAGLVAADARVFVCSFQISLGTIQTGFQIWLPHAMLEPMLAIWRQPSGEPSARYHADWHQRLTQSLQSVRVQLQARWRQPDTPLKMLAALQPGDLISLKGMPQIDDAASGNVLFAGTLQPGSPVLQMRLHGRAPAHSFHLDRAAQSGGTP